MMRDPRKLLDNLVEYGEMLQKLSAEAETMRMEAKRLDERVKDAVREEQIQRENRRHFTSRRVEVQVARREIANQLSQTRQRISETKKLLRE